ncbi:putative conserved membrane protein [Mycobacterium ulcerans str. Harvey]|uniref:Conserved membrane protein n=1 Tax=Mycobacterium ulcerans str. Harvey TaxID=1299332 RepID=A0ABN0QVV5_MYCUL|nr:putative conserved membrane protein [Mycobacterium ulcerans str. Harvey]
MGSKVMASHAARLGAAGLLLAGWAAMGVAAADPQPAPPALKTTMDHDGTYAVGTDIVPGTYTSAGRSATGPVIGSA